MSQQIFHSEEGIEDHDCHDLQVPFKGIVKEIETSLHTDTHSEVDQYQSMEGQLSGFIRAS